MSVYHEKLNIIDTYLMENISHECFNNYTNHVFTFPFTFYDEKIKIYVDKFDKFLIHDNGLIINKLNADDNIKNNWHFHKLIEKYNFKCGIILAKTVDTNQVYDTILQLLQIIMECNQIGN